MNKDSVIEENYNNWTQSPFDTTTIKNVKSLKNNNPLEFEESFYKNLSFGTGGMRGIVGIGPNRVNRYTFGKNTQGISNFINKSSSKKESVVIAYDCRNQSKELANQVADVFSSNGINVYLFSSIRPTPELSYALIKLKCICGIVLTASHNPPEYNGYKVYWKDGGQIVPPIDKKLIDEINSVKFTDISFKRNNSLVNLIDTQIDTDFIHDSISIGKIGVSKREDYRIVFTPIHGTSYKILPEVLNGAGFKNLHIVKEQAVPDGNFNTVKSPNPEEPEALSMAIDLAKAVNADIVIGTDPDADRVGLAVKNNKNEYSLLNGNQMMIILTEFILSKRKNLNKSFFIGSTVVSTAMIKNIAESYNVDFKVGLTGFKWIGKMINDFPSQNFICGGEESYGYMVGDFVRDKDAITSALVACEVGSECKSMGINLIDYLIDCYIKYGFFKEKLISVEKKGAEGLKEISSIMNKLRNSKIKSLDGSKLISFKDFQSSLEINQINGKINNLDFPKSNVLIFESEDGTTVAARPSGTEPKIKFYFSVNTILKSKEDYERVNQILNNKIVNLTKEFNF
ncbi:phospho-sugar mutase [Flavobacteriaceae bacterium]|jgi:phosphoglucomutase|nr:phospho-sugar mutase [Flavobacteriaceae bacterium]MDA8558289.1 phospho-sugar mutase [Flavobacteriaceae bacterium]MDB0023077.1 phospho-sugar mutase [Flavobacteriaceae bacterium]|tara:strand:+ start:5185 stop:6891 length:1707 start_codon:yes stop_codon:yes gene_type:complete